MPQSNTTEKDHNEASFFGLPNPFGGSSHFSSPEVDGMTKVGDAKTLPSGTRVQNYVTPQGSSLGVFFREDKQIVQLGDFILFTPQNTQKNVIGRVVALKDGKGQAAYVSQLREKSPPQVVVRIDAFTTDQCKVVLLDSGENTNRRNPCGE